MKPLKGLVILGFGGHARSVADIAFSCGIKSFVFVDEHARDGENFLGYPVQKNLPEAQADWACIPASGDNATRQKQMAEVKSKGWNCTMLISPHAIIGVGAVIGEGTMIGHQAHIGPMVKIGSGCIINTGAIVDHEAQVGDYTHVSIKSAVAGRSQIGSFCMIGAGATVIDRLKVTDNVVVGAGAAVVKSIEQPGTYVGVPARAV